MGDWPLPSQPVEAKIWLLGGGEGIRKVLASANLGKEITVSGEGEGGGKLRPNASVRPSGDPVHLLVHGVGRQAELHPAGGNAGEASEAEPQAVPPRTLLEELRVRVVGGEQAGSSRNAQALPIGGEPSL